jgi:hypothetical protein
MQLLGEEVDTQVSVLACGRRGGNADDLARTTLKDQEIANTDVVAWDGDGVGSIGRLGEGTGRSSGLGPSTTTYGNVNFFPLMMVMRASPKDTISRTVKTMTEGVVVT